METQQTQMIMSTLPANIPTPQFELFQKVRVVRSSRVRVGVITGFYYDDLNTALLNQTGCVGWHYVINYAVCASEKQLLTLINNDPSETLCGWEIEKYCVEAIAA